MTAATLDAVTLPERLFTSLRLGWLEWRATGWMVGVPLLLGAALAGTAMTGLTPSLAAFDGQVILALALALGLAFLPSPGSDRAWDLTAASAQPDGWRQVRALVLTLLLSLLLLTGLVLAFAPGLDPALVWGWFAPRAAWFAAPALLLLFRTGQPVWAAAGVLALYVAKYCELPEPINVARFQEPRLTLHLLTGALILIGVAWPWAWAAVATSRRLALGAALALLVLWPALPAPRPGLQAQVPPTTPAGWVVLQAPWSRVDLPQQRRLQSAAVSAGQSLTILTAFPEQGEPDGTALAAALHVGRFPVLLSVEGGEAKSLDWPF